MKLRLFCALALVLVQSSQAIEKAAPVAGAHPACTATMPIALPQLYGLWRAQFEGLDQGALVLLEAHPEYPGFTGGVSRSGVKSLLAGDLDQGVVGLEESDDGTRISASWQGELVEQSCGKEIRGTWTNEITDRKYPFVLRKLPG
jgi:hypothetical protein